MLDKVVNLLDNTIGENNSVTFLTTIKIISKIDADALNTLEDLGGMSEDTFSKEMFLDLVVESIKKAIFKIFKDRKIILSEETLYSFNIDKLKGLALSISYLDSLNETEDLSSIFLINDILDSETDSKIYDVINDLDKIIYILNVCSDSLTLEEYNNIVEKVYPEKIEEIHEIINTRLVLEEPYEELSLIAEDDAVADNFKIFTLVNILVNRLYSKGYNFIPETLIDLSSDESLVYIYKEHSSELLTSKLKKINLGLNVLGNAIDYAIISIFANRDITELLEIVSEDYKEEVFKIIKMFNEDENNVIKSTIEKIKELE